MKETNLFVIRINISEVLDGGLRVFARKYVFFFDRSTSHILNER